MSHIWRNLYYFFGIYDRYPEKISEENINLKNKMLEELKQVHELHFQYRYKLKYDMCILQLSASFQGATKTQRALKLINSKTNTLDMLVNLNIKLL